MDKFVKFGWQGITMEIPSNWEFSALSGDYDNGYLRMDDEDIPRMELKWAKSKEKDPDLQKILDEYFKGMRKRLEKSGVEPRIRRNIELIKDENFFKNRKVVFYNWKADVRANGAVWYCKECKRIVVVQLMGYQKENLLQLTNHVFSSIRDHPEGHTMFWSAYQLAMDVPRRYQLEKRKLMSGYLMFSFIDGSRVLNVERFGLANVILSGGNIERWFRTYYRKDLLKYGFHIEQADQVLETAPGTAMKMVGQEKRFIDRIPLSIVFVLDKIMRRGQISSYFWHCEESNRIFVVTALCKEGAEELAKSVAQSIRKYQLETYEELERGKEA